MKFFNDTCIRKRIDSILFQLLGVSECVYVYCTSRQNKFRNAWIQCVISFILISNKKQKNKEKKKNEKNEQHTSRSKQQQQWNRFRSISFSISFRRFCFDFFFVAVVVVCVLHREQWWQQPLFLSCF